MKTLIITAHPASWGFTHAIANTYKKVQEGKGGEVQLLNLYDENNKQSFLEFENLKEVSSPEQTRMHELITWADELVFIYPVWWMWMPAIMKNWFDWNMSGGFAFRYDSSGTHHTMLDGKTARFFSPQMDRGGCT